MIQDILTYTSVIAAFGYTLFSFGKTLYKTTVKLSSASACSGTCTSCNAKRDLLKSIDNVSHTNKVFLKNK